MEITVSPPAQPPAFPFTDEELREAGIDPDNVPEVVKNVLTAMRDQPDVLKPSILILQSILSREPLTDRSTPSSSLASSASSNPTTSSGSSDQSKYAPTPYEAASYYNGIAGREDHPTLVYRSDMITRPHPRLTPSDRFFSLPFKSARGVFNTSLNKVWDIVGPAIRDILREHKVQYTCIDPVRFFTHPSAGAWVDTPGTLGPPVIWIGVPPGSTSADEAHATSQAILGVLAENAAEDVVIHWREAVGQRLTVSAGPPLLRHVPEYDPTRHVRRPFTSLLTVPLTTQKQEQEDGQGSLTLWFTEGHDSNGNPSDQVFGLTNSHVLKKDTRVDFTYHPSGPKDAVRVCGKRRFDRAIVDIREAMQKHTYEANGLRERIQRLEAEDFPDDNAQSTLDRARFEERDHYKAMTALEKMLENLLLRWSDVKLQRSIGHIAYTRKISVDITSRAYTEDWGVFSAYKEKVKEGFIGNVVDLGSNHTSYDLSKAFYPNQSNRPSFKYPAEGRLRIRGCISQQDIQSPSDIDSQGEPCIMVAKDGCKTDLTVGRCSGLESYYQPELGVESREVAIYNSSLLRGQTFSDHGDSGSLVWCMRDGQGLMVGQLHSGVNKGGSTDSHVTYCTPAWWLLEQVKTRYPHANFYPESWPEL